MNISPIILHLVFFSLLLAPVSGALAAENEAEGMQHKDQADPEVTTGDKKYALEGGPEAPATFEVEPVHDNEPFYTLRADRLEYQTKEGDPIFLWDVQGWYGNDYNKLFLESEAEYLIDADEFEAATVEAFYGRTIAKFWDVKLGIRRDFEPDPQRTFGAIGLAGLAPYWFETELTAYVSEDGDISLSLELEYELLLTQKLILQPRLEAELSANEVEEYGTGQGITGYEAGLRLRYEIRREFAPYIGVSWSQTTGETGVWAEQEDEDTGQASFVAGVRAWF